MPRIKVENVPKTVLAETAPELVKIFSAAVQCPAEWVSVSDSGVTGYTNDFPVVDITWFDRPKEMQDRAAEAVKQWLKKAGYCRFEIYFHVQRKENFYTIE